MTATAYFTEAEVEAWTGLGASDFREDGEVMSTEQWTAYLGVLEPAVRSAINLFCRRTTFISSTYTELHDGKGPTAKYREFREADRKILLREQPVISITSVEEDQATMSAVPDWTERTARSDTAGGDYVLVRRGSYAFIRFHNNVPRKAINNIRVVYTAGYAEGSEVFQDLKGIALDIASKHLQRKKKLQEASAARQTGTRDAADMFPIGDPKIFTDDIKARLMPYQRARAGGRAWR